MLQTVLWLSMVNSRAQTNEHFEDCLLQLLRWPKTPSANLLLQQNNPRRVLQSQERSTTYKTRTWSRLRLSQFLWCSKYWDSRWSWRGHPGLCLVQCFPCSQCWHHRQAFRQTSWIWGENPILGTTVVPTPKQRYVLFVGSRVTQGFSAQA